MAPARAGEAMAQCCSKAQRSMANPLARPRQRHRCLARPVCGWQGVRQPPPLPAHLHQSEGPATPADNRGGAPAHGAAFRAGVLRPGATLPYGGCRPNPRTPPQPAQPATTRHPPLSLRRGAAGRKQTQAASGSHSAKHKRVWQGGRARWVSAGLMGHPQRDTTHPCANACRHAAGPGAIPVRPLAGAPARLAGRPSPAR